MEMLSDMLIQQIKTRNAEIRQKIFQRFGNEKICETLTFWSVGFYWLICIIRAAIYGFNPTAALIKRPK